MYHRTYHTIQSSEHIYSYSTHILFLARQYHCCIVRYCVATHFSPELQLTVCKQFISKHIIFLCSLFNNPDLLNINYDNIIIYTRSHGHFISMLIIRLRQMFAFLFVFGPPIINIFICVLEFKILLWQFHYFFFTFGVIATFLMIKMFSRSNSWMMFSRSSRFCFGHNRLFYVQWAAQLICYQNLDVHLQPDHIISMLSTLF